MDTPANERQCCNERHEEEMEVADTMVTTEEEAASVGTMAAGWEDEDDEIKIEDYVGQQELGASMDNGQ